MENLSLSLFSLSLSLSLSLSPPSPPHPNPVKRPSSFTVLRWHQRNKINFEKKSDIPNENRDLSNLDLHSWKFDLLHLSSSIHEFMNTSDTQPSPPTKKKGGGGLEETGRSRDLLVNWNTSSFIAEQWSQVTSWLSFVSKSDTQTSVYHLGDFNFWRNLERMAD